LACCKIFKAIDQSKKYIFLFCHKLQSSTVNECLNIKFGGLLIKLFSLLALLFVSVSCATKHESMRGSVALKIDESKGVACLASDSVRVGDGIAFYKTECKRQNPREGVSDCSMIKLGNGKITKLVNDHYSEFETTSDVKFEEGSLVESK
jgi:hypothetical protein